MMRIQSAFEYLLSYGWMVLIVAIVIAVLFESGALTPATFYPVALPGSCQVVRPNGPMSTQFLSLSGTCNTGIPQSVAEENCAWPNVYVCNPNYIKINTNQTIDPLTMSVWFWEPPTIYVTGYGIVEFGGSLAQLNGSDPGFWIGENGTTTQLCAMNYAGSNAVCNPSNTIPAKWNYAVVTMTDSVIKVYLNGQLVATGAGSPLYGDGGGFVGTNAVCQCFYYMSGSTRNYISYYNGGYEANFQVYNTTLTSADVSALYQEGINGAPIDLNNLVGWWPLNGNANDYSGNGFDGNATGIIWPQTWSSTYVGMPS